MAAGWTNAVAIVGGEGGIAVDVRRGLILPAIAPDNQIFIVTDATDVPVYMSMAAPDTSGIWIALKLSHVSLVLTETPVFVASGLGEVVLYDGIKSSPLDAYLGVDGEWVQFSWSRIILGYEWHYGATSPLLTRIEAAEGLTATAGVGMVAGQSDFDNVPIYKDIRRCNLAADGTVNAYEGDDGYTTNGTNGDVMVEIPLFYYKVEDNSTTKRRRFLICNSEATGFAPHPLFTRHDGVLRGKAYIGAYEMGPGYTSKAGAAPLTSQTRAAMRTGIGAKGTGWSMQDLAARQAIAELFRIEFATHNIQTAIGNGNVSTSSVLATGRTDGIAGHTGREAGTDGATSVVWRGFENLYGDAAEYVDGLNFNAGSFYYCLDQDSFADNTATNYTKLSFAVSTGLSTAYGTAIGLDGVASWATLPSAFGGNATAYLADSCYTGTGWGVAATGGYCGQGNAAGISSWFWHYLSTSTYAVVSSRIMYIPPA